MPTIDTPQGRFEGTQEQIDAYRKATRGLSAVTPNTPDESPDTTTGADFMTRLGASFKMTPEGKRGFYASKYGPENVAVDEKTGDIMFRERKGARRFNKADESGITLRDLADVFGDAPGAILSALGGVMGGVAGSVLPGAGTALGATAGAGTGAALGNLGKQAISAMLPGDDKMAPVDRAVSAGTDMALGGATQGLTSGGVKMIDLMRPGNLVARSAGKAAATPYAQQGKALSQDTGIPLSFADETGSRAAKTVEGMARRNPVSADTFSAFDRLQTDKAVQRINGIMDQIHASQVGDVSLGQSAQRAFDTLWDGMVSTRRAAAQSDFGAVHKLSDGQAIMPTAKMKSAVGDLISEYDLPGAGPMAKKFVGELKEMQDEVGIKITAEHFQKLLQRWGKAASGGATIFENLDKAEQRRVASIIHGALTSDLDAAVSAAARIQASPAGNAVAAAASGGAMTPSQLRTVTSLPNGARAIEKVKSGDIATALQTARDNYAANSAKLSEAGDSVIGRYFGNVSYERTPERIADTISKMKPTEIRATLGLLSRADPEMADKTARYFIEKAVEKAVPPPSASQGGTVKFSASRFLSALPDDATQAALMGGKPAQGELAKVAKVLERVADRPMQGSPTAPLMMAWDLAKGLFTLNPQALAGLPASILAPRAIAKASLTPQGRQALLTVSKVGAPMKATTEALGYLTAISMAEQKAAVDSAIKDAGAPPVAK